eukprot:12631653-Heterocapsa_arctica.AAC.1
MVNLWEALIAGLHEEMKSRDALNCALALSKTSEIELLLEQNRVMQHRLDVKAAAAPLHPAQVMAGTLSQPRLRTGDVTNAAGSTGPPDPPPEGGGG